MMPWRSHDAMEAHDAMQQSMFSINPSSPWLWWPFPTRQLYSPLGSIRTASPSRTWKQRKRFVSKSRHSFHRFKFTRFKFDRLFQGSAGSRFNRFCSIVTISTGELNSTGSTISAGSVSIIFDQFNTTSRYTHATTTLWDDLLPSSELPGFIFVMLVHLIG